MPLEDTTEPLKIEEWMRSAYRDGRCQLRVPPVCPSFWTEDDWIRWAGLLELARVDELRQAGGKP